MSVTADLPVSIASNSDSEAGRISKNPSATPATLSVHIQNEAKTDSSDTHVTSGLENSISNSSSTVGTSSQNTTSTEQALANAQRQLFVGNLPFRVRWQDLKDLFRKAGTVLRADVAMAYDNRSKGHGTVLFATLDDAKQAIKLFNNYNWQGRVLEVREDRGFIDVQRTNGNVDQISQNQFHSNDSQRRNVPPGHLGTMPPPMFPQMVTQMMAHPVGPPPSYYFQGTRGLAHSPSFAGRLLFVGNLPFQTQWQELKDLFRSAGNILRADIAMGMDNRSRGFGTVLFATTEDADQAVKMYDGYEYQGRKLRVHVDKFTSQIQHARQPTMMGPAYAGHPSNTISMTNTHDNSPIPMGSPLHQPPHPTVASPIAFHPFPPTPPLHPAFLSPGLGPFSPPLTSPTPLYGNINPYFSLNPAPGAPVHAVPHQQQQQQQVNQGASGYSNLLMGLPENGMVCGSSSPTNPIGPISTSGYPFPTAVFGPIVGGCTPVGSMSSKRPSPLSSQVTNVISGNPSTSHLYHDQVQTGIEGDPRSNMTLSNSSAIDKQNNMDNEIPNSSVGFFFSPAPFFAVTSSNPMATSMQPGPHD